MTSEKQPLLIIWGPSGRERRVLIDSAELIVGRTLECQIILADSFVSRRHARITLDHDRCFLIDLQSANGTWVNDVRVGADPVELAVGDQIALGHTILSFTYGNAPTGRLVDSPLLAGIARRRAEERPMTEVEIPADRTQRYTRIFVSHASQDDVIVTRIADVVEPKAGVDLWIDHRNRIEPGQDWDVAIQKALGQSDYLILALSPDSVNSQVVSAEWSYFWKRRKPIIPLMVRDCEVPFRLDNLHYLDFRSDFDKGVLDLITALGKLANRDDAGSS